MATLLQLIQSAAAEMSLAVPPLVIGNTNTDTVQMLYLINAQGQELQREFDWQRLNKEYRFTTEFLLTTGTVTSGSAVITGIPSTAGLDTNYMVTGSGANQDTFIASVDSATQVTMNQGASASGSVTLNFCKVLYALPSDYSQKVDNTDWDKSRHWRMIGPSTPDTWQWLKSGCIATGPSIHYRLRQNKFEIWPPITTADYLGFEYISNGWVDSAAGVAKSSFTADTDTCIYPDRLMITGLKRKYCEAKGLDPTAHTRDYSQQLELAKSNDQGGLTLTMGMRGSSHLISERNIPDSGYGS